MYQTTRPNQYVNCKLEDVLNHDSQLAEWFRDAYLSLQEIVQQWKLISGKSEAVCTEEVHALLRTGQIVPKQIEF